MIEFFRRLFAPEQSGATARERLRLVLLSDHLSLAPDVVASLRADLIAVISKYVEVDEANCDISFEQQDSAVAVLANIPILAMRSRTPPPGSPPPPAPRTPEPPPMGGTVGVAYSVFEEVDGVNSAQQRTISLPSTAAGTESRKRRRRRRAAGSPATSPG